VTGAPDRQVDAVVLGAGPAGEVAAGRLGEAGRRVVLVERELVGGECSYFACMPSKALLRPGDLVDEVKRVPGLRLARSPVDTRAALRRRDEVIHHLDDSSQLPWLQERHVGVLRGHARLEGDRQVRVGELVLQAGAVVIATGSVASVPPIPGLVEAAPWTNREVTTSERIPRRLLVLGGGVVGAEISQAYAWLGASVSVVEAEPRLIPSEEPFASDQVADGLRAAGVEVRLGERVVGAGRGPRQVRMELDDGRSLTGDELVVAVGRRPRTEDIGLETVGLDPGKPVEVDDRMRSTRHDWLYAVGDVNGRALFTHAGKYHARVAADAILGRPQTHPPTDGPMTPRVIFTDPQVAAVGHTLESAHAAGLDVRAVDHPTAAVAGASFYGRNAPGTARLVVDESRGVVVGATFTGPDVGELLHAATIAVTAEVPLERLWHAIPTFPTRSEVWLRLLEKYGL
jgi:pyruvate/2-oxoglutarate dehydrogenase complex dihydrolipoamide dehydrogenase (E3) component